jgi:hypothetical protein
MGDIVTSFSIEEMKRSILAVAFGPLTCLILLDGCTALQGRRVHLAQIPVSTIQVSPAAGPGIAPGEKSSFIVKITQQDGTVLATAGTGAGKVQWKDLSVAGSVVTVNNKGIVSLSADPRTSDGKTPHVTITVPGHPDLRADLDIPVRYDREFHASFSGAKGTDGLNGSAGMDGSDGSMGSIDLEHPSAGGNGTAGRNGDAGGDGGNGEDGPLVDVRVTLRPGSRPLLQVSVSARRSKKLFLLDPNGGSLTVTSEGGAGGAGGKGGRGGRGGAGGAGIPSGNSGSDGLDGRNGFDGHTGFGGSITVTYDPSAKSYLSAIRVPNHDGPPPLFKEVRVAPMW